MPHDTMQAKFQRLDKQATKLTTAHIGDAAVDLQCRESLTLEPGERAAVPTGIAVAIPDGYAGFVLPRSGHAMRFGISVVNSPGLIDSGYAVKSVCCSSIMVRMPSDSRLVIESLSWRSLPYRRSNGWRSTGLMGPSAVLADLAQRAGDTFG